MEGRLLLGCCERISVIDSCMITHVKTRHHGKLSYPDFSHYETWKDRNVLIGYNDTGDGKTVSMNMIKMEIVVSNIKPERLVVKIGC